MRPQSIFKGAQDQCDPMRRGLMLGAAAATLMPTLPANSQTAFVSLEGVSIPDAVTAYGHRLVLNGAGVRKRGYSKADVTALYLPEKRTTAEPIYKLNGVRRIQLNMLHDFNSSMISRIFISDLKQAATDDEFRKLIPVIGQIGAAYSNIWRVLKGDVINLDWLPGKGWMSYHNGKPLQFGGAASGASAINSELAYQVYLRMYIGEAAPEELRDGLLGLTRLIRTD